MRLQELLSKTYPQTQAQVSPEIEINSIECDSRKIRSGSLFIAVRGFKQNGLEYIPDAVQKGAAAVIVDQKIEAFVGIPVVQVPDAREATARIASVFHGHPASKLKMIGVTGTNGKTTSAYLLEYLLNQAGRKTGLIGTIETRIGIRAEAAGHTTPDALELQALLARMLREKCEYVPMEVSSHALDQKRTDGIDFEAAIFTNLTQDHLDYHETMEKYFEAKSKLFLSLAKDKSAILNADDLWARRLKDRLQCRVFTFSAKNDADLRAENIRSEDGRTVFEIFGRDNHRHTARLPLVGYHNVYNSLGVLMAMQAMSFSIEKCVKDIENFKGVPGRLESVDCGQAFSCFVDFAHTPDGLLNVLTSLRPYKKRKLIVVFGCGGDRDKSKRPKMGAVAAQHADFVFITSDNPRSENPKTICEEIRAGLPAGFKDFAVVPDRRKAIRQALLAARKEDIVLLAGKGHESTQIIGSETLPFSDREEAEKVLNGH